MLETVSSNHFGEHTSYDSNLLGCTLMDSDNREKTYRMPQRPLSVGADRPLPLREQLELARQERIEAQNASYAVPMIDRMQLALTAFQEATKRDIPIQHLVVFLTVGRYPGKAQIEYARMLPTDSKQSTISRQLTDLSIELRTREPGYGLLEFKTNLRNRRENIYTLSPKGATLYEKIIRILEQG